MSARSRAPFLARLLVSGAAIMTFANSITVPFGGLVGPLLGGLLLSTWNGVVMFLGALALLSMPLYLLVGRRVGLRP